MRVVSDSTGGNYDDGAVGGNVFRRLITAQYPQNRGDKQGPNFTDSDPRQFSEIYVDV